MSAAKKRDARIKHLSSRIKEPQNKKEQDLIGPPDTMMLLIIAALVVFGIMAIVSAGAPEGAAVYHNPAYFAIKHIVAVIIGIIAMVFTSNIDYKKWKNWTMPFAMIVTGLTAATLIPGIGRADYGSSRWLMGLPIQPSEFAKIASIFLVASAVTDSKNLFSRKMVENLIIVAVLIIIVLKQPNLSIAVILTMITLALLMIGGASFRLIGGFGFSSLAMLMVFGLQNILHGYQMKRITGWLNPWSDPQGIGYNIIQSLYAIGSGQFIGTGYGNSLQKHFWLPFCYTDFIFAVICEEFGFVGAVLLIGLFLTFIYRGFLIANRCTNHFGKLVAFGITFSIAIQAFINMAVATGVFPVTGVTLPLISHGGTSIVITLAMLGVLLNISKKRIKKIHPQAKQEENHARIR
jgi:cell division protein FtsW